LLFDAITATEETPGIALASTAPVKVPVAPVGEATVLVGHAPVKSVPSAVLASYTHSFVCCVAVGLLVVELAGQTNATAKLVVPLRTVKLTLPDASVAAVNCPDPIWVATAVGVVPEIVNVIVVGLAGVGGGVVPVPPPVFAVPPHPAIKRRITHTAENRAVADRIKELHCSAVDKLRAPGSEPSARPLRIDLCTRSPNQKCD
jgi:hypothetical protein